jgi:hypothetical protein
MEGDFPEYNQTSVYVMNFPPTLELLTRPAGGTDFLLAWHGGGFKHSGRKEALVGSREKRRNVHHAHSDASELT